MVGPYGPFVEPGRSVTVVNAYSDGAAGVAELLAEDAGDVPIALVAVTVNVYAVPVVKPLTVIGDDPPVPVTPPGLDVTV
jgi:hypothetical protein